MRSLATWCVRHRRVVVACWVVALVGFTFAARSIGTDYSNSFSLPHTESSEAYSLLASVSPKVSGDTEQIVFSAPPGKTVHDPAVRAQIESMLGRVAATAHVTRILSPYTAAGSTQVSRDGSIAFASVTFDIPGQSIPTADALHFVKVAQSGSGHGVHVAVAGQVAEKANPPALGGMGLGVIAAGVVLFLVFGSLFAMALPLVSALASLGTAIGVIDLLSNVMKMPEFSTQLVLLIGLGVGVDYALFILSRHRQGLLAGRNPEASIVTAVNTSGRAVLFAGIIVCIALLGMFALQISFLYGLAIAASIGVLFTMAAALTLLPAMLGFLGPRVLSRRQRRRLTASGPVLGHHEGFWARWARFISRRPALPATFALVLIVVLAVPFFSLRLGSSDQGNDPPSTTTRQAYDLLAKGFGPGFNGPLEIVSVVKGAADRQALHKVVAAIAAQPGVARVAPVVEIPTRTGGLLALVTVYPTSAPQAAATTTLIDHLRQSTIPAAVAASPLVVYVGGTTAIFVDFADVLSQKLPLFIGVVVVLSFLLLALVFRSLVIPLTAAVMNLLSVGAAFGILVAVFQNGWLGGLFGVSRPGPIEAFLPVMLFAILFGLSMDYEVFLVTRIHEEWLRTGDNTLAVRNGLAATGRTITAAAFIMILVFGSFILGGQLVIKEFGLGLAGGILVDAIVIRSTIVPAVMRMLGKSNWWFPSWLDRVLPHVSVDATEPEDDLALLPGDEPEGGRGEARELVPV